MAPKFTKAKLTKVFAYLDRLRASGVTNMWGAGVYIENQFAMDDASARAALGLWIESFSDEPPVVRAANAFAAQFAA